MELLKKPPWNLGRLFQFRDKAVQWNMLHVSGEVVHCQKEDYDIYIGRPSFWQNHWSHKEDTQAMHRVGSRAEAVARYEEYVLKTPELLSRLDELREKRLGCWCAPQACHGHVLADLASRERVLVTGSRSWTDQTLIYRRLAQLPPSIIIHGACRGADSQADHLADECGHKTAVFPADGPQGSHAGFARNEVMLACAPHRVLAFIAQAKSPGTWAMVRAARAAHIECEVWRPEEREQLPPIIVEKQLGLFDNEPS